MNMTISPFFVQPVFGRSNRRDFLRGAAVATAAIVATPVVAGAQNFKAATETGGGWLSRFLKRTSAPLPIYQLKTSSTQTAWKGLATDTYWSNVEELNNEGIPSGLPDVPSKNKKTINLETFPGEQQDVVQINIPQQGTKMIAKRYYDAEYDDPPVPAEAEMLLDELVINLDTFEGIDLVEVVEGKNPVKYDLQFKNVEYVTVVGDNFYEGTKSKILGPQGTEYQVKVSVYPNPTSYRRVEEGSLGDTYMKDLLAFRHPKSSITTSRLGKITSSFPGESAQEMEMDRHEFYKPEIAPDLPEGVYSRVMVQPRPEGIRYPLPLPQVIYASRSKKKNTLRQDPTSGQK